MPSFKHVAMAMACLVSHHFGLTTALSAYQTSVSIYPSELPYDAPDHRHGGPDFEPNARNHTKGMFSSENGSANNTDRCHDLPGNHTRHSNEHERHHNQTGIPEDVHFRQIKDTQPPKTPTDSFLTLTTPPPDSTALNAGNGAKLVQTTYYSCVTIGPDSHCGWHEPILDASMDSASYKISSNAWLYGFGVVAAMVCL